MVVQYLLGALILYIMNIGSSVIDANEIPEERREASHLQYACLRNGGVWTWDTPEQTSGTCQYGEPVPDLTTQEGCEASGYTWVQKDDGGYHCIRPPKTPEELEQLCYEQGWLWNAETQVCEPPVPDDPNEDPSLTSGTGETADPNAEGKAQCEFEGYVWDEVAQTCTYLTPAEIYLRDTGFVMAPNGRETGRTPAQITSDQQQCIDYIAQGFSMAWDSQNLSCDQIEPTTQDINTKVGCEAQGFYYNETLGLCTMVLIAEMNERLRKCEADKKIYRWDLNSPEGICEVDPNTINALP